MKAGLSSSYHESEHQDTPKRVLAGGLISFFDKRICSIVMSCSIRNPSSVTVRAAFYVLTCLLLNKMCGSLHALGFDDKKRWTRWSRTRAEELDGHGRTQILRQVLLPWSWDGFILRFVVT